jgi:hypothetical protein
VYDNVGATYPADSVARITRPLAALRSHTRSSNLSHDRKGVLFEPN